MRFCDDCGSYLRKAPGGLWCSKCKKLVPADSRVKITRASKPDSKAVFVVNDPAGNYATVNQACPKCGNEEAFSWVSSISGEHAGIRRERTVEHFKCTKCSHSWSKSR